jgi:hypothetical protein
MIRGYSLPITALIVWKHRRLGATQCEAAASCSSASHRVWSGVGIGESRVKSGSSLTSARSFHRWSYCSIGEDSPSLTKCELSIKSVLSPARYVLWFQTIWDHFPIEWASSNPLYSSCSVWRIAGPANQSSIEGDLAMRDALGWLRTKAISAISDLHRHGAPDGNASVSLGSGGAPPLKKGAKTASHESPSLWIPSFSNSDERPLRSPRSAAAWLRFW